MKKTVFILAAVVVAFSVPAHAKGNYEAGKAKSATCAACHGVTGVSTVPSFPKLAGQQRDYLYHSLKAYKTGKRKNPIMAGQAQALSEEDMLDLALFFSKQQGLTLKY